MICPIYLKRKPLLVCLKSIRCDLILGDFALGMFVLVNQNSPMVNDRVMDLNDLDFYAVRPETIGLMWVWSSNLKT